MTDDDILRMAIECQLVTTGNREGIYSEALMRFAKLVAAHEREECAKLFETITKDTAVPSVHFSLADTAKLIRERNNT